MLGSILRFFLLGLVGIIALGVLLGVLGIVAGLAILALKVGVVVAIGYGAVKLFQAVTGKKPPKELSAADKKWLDS